MKTTASKPCRHSNCVHFKENLSTAEYRKIKHCGACGHAYVNKISLIDNLLYGLDAPKDKFISIRGLRKKHNQMIWEVTLIGGLLTILGYWIYINVW